MSERLKTHSKTQKKSADLVSNKLRIGVFQRYQMKCKSVSKKSPRYKYQNRGTIKYVWTTNGPEPLDYQRSPLDYEHYLTRQLQPVAEGILPFIEDNFATLMTGQLGLF